MMATTVMIPAAASITMTVTIAADTYNSSNSYTTVVIAVRISIAI